MLLAAAASPAFAVAAPAALRPGAASSSPRRGLLTAQTAPDTASRLALAQPLPRLTSGAGPGTDLAQVIHRNFPVAVERNFASLPAHRVAAWLDAMDDATLANLAQLYLNASELVGRRNLAIDILAQRLDPLRLARVARFFGFARVHQSLLRASPGKESSFMQAASPQFRGPDLGLRVVMRPGPTAAAAGTPAIGLNSYSPFLEYTLEEIYLSFRTAPVGATGVVASMFQTTMVVGTATYFAWGVGTTIGGWLASGLQTFAPGVWESLGDRLGAWMEEFRRAPSLPPDHLPSPEERIGQLEQEAFYAFDVPPETYDDFALDGGDYGSTEAWSDHVPYEPYGGGNFCGRIPDCDALPLRQRLRRAGSAR
jgi:hypothetical protein